MGIMNSNAGLEWAEALRGVFPAKVTIVDRSASGALFLREQWWVETDAFHLRKKSRPVDIVIPGDLLELYDALSLDEQRVVRENVAKRLRLKVLAFDPDHNTPWYRLPPPKRWTITREDLE